MKFLCVAMLYVSVATASYKPIQDKAIPFIVELPKFMFRLIPCSIPVKPMRKC